MTSNAQLAGRLNAEAAAASARRRALLTASVALSKAKATIQEKVAAIKRELAAEKTINSEGGGPVGNANPDIIRVSETGAYGTNADYVTRRIARDRPDILDRLEAGDFRSIPGTFSDCPDCDYQAIIRFFRAYADHGCASTRKRPGMSFDGGSTVPSQADSARAHALLDELGWPQ